MRFNPEIQKIEEKLRKNNFNDVLFFISGFGLGDIIYCNRLLSLLKKQQLYDCVIVFSSKTWKEINLAPHLNMDVINVPEITEYPDRVKWSKIVAKNLSVFCRKSSIVTWDSIHLPEKFSNHETVFETMCRGLNLTFEATTRRGLIPISNSAQQLSVEILSSNGLIGEKYVVLGPQTGSHKRWGDENYSKLGKRLLDELGLRSVIVGLKGDSTPKIPESVEALSLPLDAISEIITHSVFFIGNDSGITHLAGCSDIPVYEIFSKARREPLVEWRTLGPFVRYFIEPNLDRAGFIQVSDVFNMIKIDYEYFSSEKSIKKHVCFACSSIIEYVLGSNDESIVFLCRCGIKYTYSKSSFLNGNCFESLNTPFFKIVDESQNARTILREEDEIEVCFERSKSLLNTQGNLDEILFHMSFDGLLHYFKKYGYIVGDLKFYGNNIVFINKKRHPNKINKFYIISWDNRKGIFFSMSDYINFFQWATFATQFRATTIPRAIIQYRRSPADAFRSALFLFSLYRDRKSLLVFLKTLFRCVPLLLGRKKTILNMGYD